MARTAADEEDAELDGGEALLEYGAQNVPVLQEPEDSLDDLDDEYRDSRGDERAEIARDRAIRHLIIAENADDDREAKRHYRSAAKDAKRALRGKETSRAEMDFIEIWAAWRAGARVAGKLARKFTEKHRDSGDLFLMAWIIRGEIEYEAESFKKASEHYRYLSSYLEHPLYAFAQLRTGECAEEQGDSDAAEDAYEYVRGLGCKQNVGPLIELVSVAAAARLGSDIVDDGKTMKPADCNQQETAPVKSSRDIEDEKPPGFK